jgi:two-component system chemotaxis sensor kinase CheA
MMTNELQQLVMKTRMVKIGKVFNKYPRLVRDLSKIADKKINLVIEGEETELDKTLIEEINDPLVHLIRNSVDHGIEKENVRIENGKEPVGTIKLSAQQEGNTIIITIEDDGKGIDPEVIKNKAVSKGLISREKAEELTKQEIYNLIFLPGFSTAEVVTNISGRGVGMDVVKTNVTKLRGTIEIDSVPKKGTKISIRLPLTLAIISGLVVKVQNEQFVIPLSLVIEVIRVHKDNIYYVNQKPNIKLRDKVIPVVSLREKVLKVNGKKNTDYQYVVIVGLAEKQIGLEVDGLIGQKEIVIKSLGNLIGKIPGIAGSTILGDGSIILILDVAEIINLS